MEFAIQDPDHRGNYESVATMRTNKFINPTARTVKRFTGRPSGSDYGPGTDTLLVWGRPGFSGQQGRQAQIYLFAHRLPIKRAANGRWRFRPRFYVPEDDPAPGLLEFFPSAARPATPVASSSVT